MPPKTEVGRTNVWKGSMRVVTVMRRDGKIVSFYRCIERSPASDAVRTPLGSTGAEAL